MYHILITCIYVLHTWSKRRDFSYLRHKRPYIKRADNACLPDKSLSTFILWMIVLMLNNWWHLPRFAIVSLPTGNCANPKINTGHTRRFGATRTVVHLACSLWFIKSIPKGQIKFLTHANLSASIKGKKSWGQNRWFSWNVRLNIFCLPTWKIPIYTQSGPRYY